MSKPPTPLADASPELRAAAIKTAVDRDVQNPIASYRRAELIAELEQSITPTMTAGELRELHGSILTLKAANQPKPPPPPIDLT
jgi:hypothetical protein